MPALVALAAALVLVAADAKHGIWIQSTPDSDVLSIKASSLIEFRFLRQCELKCII